MFGIYLVEELCTYEPEPEWLFVLRAEEVDSTNTFVYILT